MAQAPNVESPPSISDSYVIAQSRPYTFDLTPTADGYCVSFVQKNGFQNYHGNANQWIKYINSKVPRVGSAVVESYGTIGHLALVTSITKAGIEVYEQNFVGRWIVSHRILNTYELIGYINPH